MNTRWIVADIGDCCCSCRNVLLFTSAPWAAAGCLPICLGCTLLRGTWWKHIKCSDDKPTISELATAWQQERAKRVYVAPVEVDPPGGWPRRSNYGHRLRPRG